MVLIIVDGVDDIGEEGRQGTANGRLIESGCAFRIA